MRKVLIASILASVAIANNTYAEIKPRSMATDKRIKIVYFDPNNIVTLKARYGYETQIAFSPSERVQNVSLGDSLGWLAVPVNNYLFIKPVTSSKTNMTVITNLYSYNFQLDSLDANISPTYKLQFAYSKAGYDQNGKSNAIADFDPDNINWKYTFTGYRSLAPIEAFDNGQFTYFKFKNGGMDHLPAVFIVEKNRKETLVNYHMQGNYLVVNAVAKQFTLRDGDYATSVYNDLAIGDWDKI